MAPTVHSLPPPPGSDIDFGAIVENVDLENLTGMRLHRVVWIGANPAR